jgi:glycosyltransferase involved in cell wall biosynthesis
MPKVSVVMPVFNGEQYIKESIGSVLNQSMTDLELIVVNDGSSDNTLEILKTYAKQDSRVKVLDRPNSGRPSFPKNDGIAAASADYICFLDHDDLYDADRTRQLVVALDSHPNWIAAFHDMRFIGSEGETIPYRYLADSDFLLRASPYLTPLSDDWFECSETFYIFQSLITGAMHTSTVMIAMNRLPNCLVNFDTKFTICDDTDLWIRLGMQGKMGYLNQDISSYRQHQTSITRNREKFLLDTALLHKHNFHRVKDFLNPDQVRQLRSRIASCIGDIAYLKYEQYCLMDARIAYREAFSWFPRWKTGLSLIKTYIPESILRFMKNVCK